jgi:hypothetical protein
MLPIGRLHGLDYFTYNGSLTTPPCSQVVRWYVLRLPAIITRAQLDRFQSFSHAMPNQTVPFAVNSNQRPLQRLRSHQVLEHVEGAHLNLYLIIGLATANAVIIVAIAFIAFFFLRMRKRVQYASVN